MKNERKPETKPRLKVCGDLKAHLEKQSTPQTSSDTVQARCIDDVCSLNDWKPRKEAA